MRKRLALVSASVGALAVGGLLLFSPAAHATTKASTSGVTIPISCTVIPLGSSGLQITLCL